MSAQPALQQRSRVRQGGSRGCQQLQRQQAHFRTTAAHALLQPPPAATASTRLQCIIGAWGAAPPRRTLELRTRVPAAVPYTTSRVLRDAYRGSSATQVTACGAARRTASPLYSPYTC